MLFGKRQAVLDHLPSIISHLWRPKKPNPSENPQVGIMAPQAGFCSRGKNSQVWQLSPKDKKDEDSLVTHATELGASEIDTDQLAADLGEATVYLVDLLDDQGETLSLHAKIFYNAVGDIVELLVTDDGLATQRVTSEDAIESSDHDDVGLLIFQALLRAYQVLENLDGLEAETPLALLALDGSLAKAEQKVTALQDDLPNFAFLRAIFVAPLLARFGLGTQVLSESLHQAILDVSVKINAIHETLDGEDFPKNNKAIIGVVRMATAVLHEIHEGANKACSQGDLGDPAIAKMVTDFVERDVEAVVNAVVGVLPWYWYERFQTRQKMVEVLEAFGEGLDVLQQQAILNIGLWPVLTRIFHVDVTLVRLQAARIDSEIDAVTMSHLVKIKKMHDWLKLHGMIDAPLDDDDGQSMTKRELLALMQAAENGLSGLVQILADLRWLDQPVRQKIVRLATLLMTDLVPAAWQVSYCIQGQSEDLFDEVSGPYEEWLLTCAPLIATLLACFEGNPSAVAILRTAQEAFDIYDDAVADEASETMDDVADEFYATFMNMKAYAGLAEQLQNEIEAVSQNQVDENLAVTSVPDADLIEMFRATTAILVNYEALQQRVGLDTSVREIEHMQLATQMLTEALPLLAGAFDIVNERVLDGPQAERQLIVLINQAEEAAQSVQKRFAEAHFIYGRLAVLLRAYMHLRSRLMGRPFLIVGGRVATRYTPEDEN